MPSLIQAVTSSIIASASQNMSVPTTATGNELICIVGINETTSANNLSGIVDSAGNTWTRVATIQTSAGASAGNITLDVWHSAAAQSISSLTVTSASAMATASLVLLELNGISATSAIDASATSTTLTATTLTTSVTPTLPNDAYIFVAASAFSQLLDANTSSMETSAAGWAAGANTTLTQDAAHALEGTKALKVVSTASGVTTATTAAAYAVTEGQQYTFSYFVFTTLAAHTLTSSIQWQTSGGATQSTATSTATALTANQWTPVTFTATAPTGLSVSQAKLVTQPLATAGADAFWADEFQFAPGVLNHVADAGTTPIATAITNSPTIAVNGGSQVVVAGTTLLPQTATAHSTVFSQVGAPKAGVAIALNIGSNTVITGAAPAGLTSSFQLLYNNLTVGAGTSYGLKDVTGIRELPPMRILDDPQLQSDGTWIAPDWLGGRTIAATLTVIGSTDADVANKLQAAENAFLPITGSTTETALYWQLPAGTLRRVWGRVRKRLVGVDKMYQIHAPALALEFYCSDPKLYEVFDTTSTLSPGTALSGRTYSRTFNFVYGSGANPNAVNVTNNGNVATFPVLTFYGPITDPKVFNNTMGTITWFAGVTMVAGDILVVDCGNKTALLNGVSITGKQVQGTQWIQLQPGTNNISYSPTSGLGQCVVTFRSAWI